MRHFLEIVQLQNIELIAIYSEFHCFQYQQKSFYRFCRFNKFHRYYRFYIFYIFYRFYRLHIFYHCTDSTDLYRFYSLYIFYRFTDSIYKCVGLCITILIYMRFVNCKLQFQKKTKSPKKTKKNVNNRQFKTFSGFNCSNHF